MHEKFKEFKEYLTSVTTGENKSLLESITEGFDGIYHQNEEPAGEGFMYPDAGELAQPEIKAAIERFRKLDETERSKQPLLFWLIGESTPDLKVSKRDSQYTDKSQVENQTCGNCHFAYTRSAVGNRHICSQIDGPVELPGWCNRWMPYTDK